MDFIGGFYESSEEDMEAAARGQFTFFGRSVPFGSVSAIDWSYCLPEENDHHLWRMKLNQLEVVHSLLRSEREERRATAVALLEQFSSAQDASRRDAFVTRWSPYVVSHRLLAMISGLASANRKQPVDEVLRATVESFARLDAAFLWRNIEHELRNNHTERNLAALCLYHMAAGSITKRQTLRLNRYVAAIIRATILPDGTQVERSAMYQGLSVMSTRIFAACPFLSVATQALAKASAKSAAEAWSFLTHEDGEISLFNDSWIGEVPSPNIVLGPPPSVAPSYLPDGGYYKLSSGNITGVMDAGQIGPRWNPGHGHADFLSLEIDVEGKRFLVDPGTSTYSTGSRRTFERSASSHNGPTYENVEPVTYAGCFRVGRMAAAKPISAPLLRELPVPAIGGSLTTSAGSVLRIVCSVPSGGLLVIDRWTASRPRGSVALLVPRDWEIARLGPQVVSFSKEGIPCAVTVHRGSIGRERQAQWCRHFMSPEIATAITLTPHRSREKGQSLAFGINVIDTSEVSGLWRAVDIVATHALAM